MAAAVIVEVLAGGRLVAALPPPPPESELLPTRDVIASFPPPPPLQSPVRKAVAAVLARSRLAAAAADALIAAMAASHVAVRVQGEGSRANAVALQVSLAASLVVLPVVPVALSLHAIRIAVSGTGEDTEPDKPAPESFAASVRASFSHPILAASAAITPFAVLVPVGNLVKGISAASGSRGERIGSAIEVVGLVGFYPMFLFFFLPTAAWMLSGMLHHVLRFIEIHPLVKSGEIDTVGFKRSAVKMDKDLEDDSC
ncbi:hypothetical protein OsJ_27340 [Oryza sativa Japonica Group]|uniref:Uncharacterized protein n=1 Tax=Oryza sativa subsp. japonica TaxID=39947 RepID=B9G0X9_ORYSJ|nr:hypothetical protein OsJ_27340 [Oryza sativa Japonica Group]